ncbi:MAG: hypothetical protein IKU23_03120 [Clostridia bacterium]|nr:hypothetical protein [Clostridia bacterium]
MTGSITGWIRLFIKRYSFGVKIKHICKKKGFILNKNGFLWWLGKNKSGKCNFTICCGNESYCVKLIGVRSKRILFGFVNKNTYEIKDYTFALPHTTFDFDYELKNKEPYRFDNGSTPCIVMVPNSVKVTVRSNDAQQTRIEIGSRDKTPEGEFFFADRFLTMLKDKTK